MLISLLISSRVRTQFVFMWKTSFAARQCRVLPAFRMWPWRQSHSHTGIGRSGRFASRLTAVPPLVAAVPLALPSAAPPPPRRPSSAVAAAAAAAVAVAAAVAAAGAVVVAGADMTAASSWWVKKHTHGARAFR